jgi:hypothetical protein
MKIEKLIQILRVAEKNGIVEAKVAIDEEWNMIGDLMWEIKEEDGKKDEFVFYPVNLKNSYDI